MALMLVAVAIFGLLPFTAFADDNASAGDAVTDNAGTSAGEQPNLVSPAPAATGTIRERIHERLQNLRELKSQAETAKDAFVAAKATYRVNKALVNELKREARAYLKKNLLIIKDRLEKLADDNAIYEGMDADVSFVDDGISASDANLTSEQIVKKAHDVKERWLKIQAKLRHALVLRSLHMTATVTRNADGLYNKLANITAKLKENGTDVTNVEIKLADYKALVDEAAAALNETVSTYFEGRIFNAIQAGNISGANGLMAGATKALNAIKQDQIREAHALLKEIAQDLRTLLGIGQGKPIRAEGTGTAKAAGKGIVGVHGNGTVVAGGTGVLVVKDNAGDAVVKVRGVGKRYVLSDYTVVYKGRGVARVTGSNVSVVVYGNIKVAAEGTGVFVAKGQGTYEIESAAVSSSEDVSSGTAETMISIETPINTEPVAAPESAITPVNEGLENNTT